MIARTAIAGIVCVSLCAMFLKVNAQEFHTSPYCWEAPRMYATGESESVEVAIRRVEEKKGFVSWQTSPNGAYEFTVTGRENDSDPEWFPRLLINTERPYLLEIEFPNTVAISEADWVNEGLVYLRMWWGRRVASDFIIDVEKETVIYQQPIRHGDIAFEQFKQCAEPEWQDSAQCQCVDTPASSTTGSER